MKAPFEKFVVQSVDVNSFMVRTTSPEAIREALKDFEAFARTNTEPSIGKVMLERCLFIEDAIRAKLEESHERRTEA